MWKYVKHYPLCARDLVNHAGDQEIRSVFSRLVVASLLAAGLFP